MIQEILSTKRIPLKLQMTKGQTTLTGDSELKNIVELIGISAFKGPSFWAETSHTHFKTTSIQIIEFKAVIALV